MKGGKREGAGRKPTLSEKKRSIRKLYRWSSGEYETITKAAEASGKTEAAFVRDAVLNRLSISKIIELVEQFGFQRYEAGFCKGANIEGFKKHFRVSEELLEEIRKQLTKS